MAYFLQKTHHPCVKQNGYVGTTTATAAAAAATTSINETKVNLLNERHQTAWQLNAAKWKHTEKYRTGGEGRRRRRGGGGGGETKNP